MMPLSLVVLKARQEHLAALIKQAEEHERHVDLLRKFVKEHGITSSDLRVVARSMSTRAGCVHQHPTDPSKKWSGRGRKPRWLIEAVAAGTMVEAGNGEGRP